MDQDYLRKVFTKLSSLKGAGVALGVTSTIFLPAGPLGRLRINVLWSG